MTKLDDARRAWGRLVATGCAVDPKFAENFHTRDRDGRRVVIALLENDTLNMACRLVRQSGGGGVVAVLRSSLMAPGRKQPVYALLAMELHQRGEQGDDDCSVPFHSDTRLADILAVVGPGIDITLHLARDDMRVNKGPEVRPVPRKALAATAA